MKDNRERPSGSSQGQQPLRLIALSDGLFATVLTLLVLDLKIPDALNAAGGNVEAFVKGFGPHLLSYLLTFLVAGIYWMAHHRDFDQVIGYNRGLLSYNLAFLLFIGLFPFSTAALNAAGSGAGIFQFFWAIYAANVALAGIMLTLTWNYAVSHGLATPETMPEQRRRSTVQRLVIPAVFLVSIFVQSLSSQAPLGPLTLWIIPLVLWWVNRPIAPHGPESRAGRPDWGELMWRAGWILPWLLMFGLAIWAIAH